MRRVLDESASAASCHLRNAWKAFTACLDSERFDCFPYSKHIVRRRVRTGVPSGQWMGLAAADLHVIMTCNCCKELARTPKLHHFWLRGSLDKLGYCAPKESLREIYQFGTCYKLTVQKAQTVVLAKILGGHFTAASLTGTRGNPHDVRQKVPTAKAIIIELPSRLR